MRSNQVACHSFFESLFGIATRLFEPILDFWQVLKLCRFAVLTVIITAYLLIWNPQGREVLIRLQTDGSLSGSLAFLCVVIFWAWVIWYSCRVILSFQFWDWPPRTMDHEREARIRSMHRMTPRVLGIIAFLVVATALFRSVADTENAATGVVLTLLYALCAGLFARIVWKRHDWAQYLRDQHPLTVKLLGDPPPSELQRLNRYDELPKQRKWGVRAFFICLSLIPFLIFQTRGLNLVWAPVIMSPAILILAASSWVPIGTLLVYWSGHYRIPIFTILTVYLVLVSTMNDNHHVRTVPLTIQIGPPVSEHFKKWLPNGSSQAVGKPPIPVVLIAAEGGGIRAAYWTASILSRLQADREDFASHVFVISGVSGGSLGAGLFAALLAEHGNRGLGDSYSDFLDYSKTMLRKDFLAPTFATMLYPELLQRFLFWRVPYWDRGRTLEASWEHAWQSVSKSQSNLFAQSFEGLWSGRENSNVPSLIFNMTSVEYGTRVLMSNLRIDEAQVTSTCLEAFSGRAQGIFDDVIDFRRAVNAHRCNGPDPLPLPTSVPLSTAINNSARFSFVSPAGTVNDRLHIVDGGYFEDSGTTTLGEVYQGIRAHLTERQKVIILYLNSDPGDGLEIGALYQGPLDTIIEGAHKSCIRVKIQEGEIPSAVRMGASECPLWSNRLPGQVAVVANRSLRNTLQVNHFYTMRLDKDNEVIQLYEPDVMRLDEVATPLYTVFRARLARGTHAAAHLKRLKDTGSFIPFQLRKAKAALPLGWTLSEEATTEMDRQLNVLFEKCEKTGSLLQYFQSCWPNYIDH